jgi:hypothetical protein
MLIKSSIKKKTKTPLINRIFRTISLFKTAADAPIINGDEETAGYLEIFLYKRNLDEEKYLVSF